MIETPHQEVNISDIVTFHATLNGTTGVYSLDMLQKSGEIITFSTPNFSERESFYELEHKILEHLNELRGGNI